MAEQPILTKPIPPQIVNEGATYGPLHLSEFIQVPPDTTARFSAALSDGRPLPKGLICTSEGLVNGIAGAETKGAYKVVITVEDSAGGRLTTEFDLTIKERLTANIHPEFLNKLKTQVWEALGKNLPLPEFGDMLNRPITAVELYYLLQRFATLTIWDVYNLDYPSEKNLLTLGGASQHYHIYDRGSCLIGVPKDLFSHERTLEDALQTARVMAREVYKRGWVIEFAGFDKMVRAGWVELQVLGDKHGKHLEVLHFSPSVDDVKLYSVQAKAEAAKGM